MKLGKYEITQNVHGWYIIINTKTDELLTYGGTTLFLDTEREAIEFLVEQELI